MFPEKIETARLELKALTTDEIHPAELHRHCSSHNPTIEEEFRYLPWTPHRTIHETKEWIDDAETRWRDGERATYLIRAGEELETPDDVVGVIYLDVFWERLAGEPVMWARKPYWGKGLLMEVAVAVHRLGLVDLELDVLFTEVIEGNERARTRFESLYEQHCAEYEGKLRNKVRLGDEVKDVYRYSISREEFQEAIGAEPIEFSPSRTAVGDD